MTIYSFSNEIPREIKKKIEKTANFMYEGNEKKNYIKWQVDSYERLHQEIQKSTLKDEEKQEIIYNLEKMYADDYAKQYSKLKDEIEKKVFIDKKAEVKAQKIKIEKLETISETIMKRFESEAKRLYPKNDKEQKKYIDSSIENYKFIIQEIKK